MSTQSECTKISARNKVEIFLERHVMSFRKSGMWKPQKNLHVIGTLLKQFLENRFFPSFMLVFVFLRLYWKNIQIRSIINYIDYSPLIDCFLCWLFFTYVTRNGIPWHYWRMLWITIKMFWKFFGSVKYML